MALDQTKRLNPKTLETDDDALAAIKDMTPTYAPTKAEFSVANMDTAKDLVDTTNDAEAQAEADLKTKRDAACAAEWAYHNKLLGAKDQVVAQYGEDSDQVQAVGLKKKSERKRPARRAPKPPTP